jgi:hypothetical protein
VETDAERKAQLRMKVLIAAHSLAVSIMGLENNNLSLLVQKASIRYGAGAGVLRS